MMLTIILLLWLIPIAVNVYIDREGKKPNYTLVNTLRGMAAILHGLILDLVCGYFPEQMKIDPSVYSIWELVKMFAPIFLFQITSYWILFELAYNKVRGREPLYFDRKERDSGITDKIFDALGNGAHLTAKIIALVICVLSIIKIYYTV